VLYNVSLLDLFCSVAEPRSPQGSDTSLFLSRLNTIWKGFINLQSVAKFITKAYPVSGCFDYLSEVSTDMFMRLECIAVPVVRKAGVTVYGVILDV